MGFFSGFFFCLLLVAWVGGVLGFFEGVWFALLCFFARTAD